PSEILAAFLLGQLEQFESVQARRAEIFRRYVDGLTDWARTNSVTLPHIPADCEPAYHMFHIRLPRLESRERFIAHLKEASMYAVFHYLPLHLAPMSRQWGYQRGDCALTEQVSDQLVRLPFYTGMTRDDQNRVIERVRSFHA